MFIERFDTWTKHTRPIFQTYQAIHLTLLVTIYWVFAFMERGDKQVLLKGLCSVLKNKSASL